MWTRALLLLILAFPAVAEVPVYVSYRAALVLDDGRAVPDGLCDLAFSIHDAPSGGNLLFSQMKTAHVVNGWYEVHLVDEPGAPLLDALAGSPRFLQVEIRSGGGFTNDVLSPRQALTSAPWALVARAVEEAEAPPGGIPTGAVILWDQTTGCGGAPGACPCGFSAALELGGRTILGALDAPGNAPGQEVGTPGASGDVLTASEMPSHSHQLASAGLHRHGISVSYYYQTPQGSWNASDNHRLIPTTSSTTRLGPAGAHSHAIGTAGGGGPHYHPFRTVLFCRKDAP